ncbi:MAG: hypothetical protein QNJ72_34250 [Pleurocapsa sp. MO_226.B13]|nr:hypothetical protein [Pleurocapsa sp. MO_226.B13]
MSKPLEEMTVKELRQYMFEHRNHSLEWEKAYDVFSQKVEWNKTPTNATPEEEKQIIESLIAQKMQK